MKLIKPLRPLPLFYYSFRLPRVFGVIALTVTIAQACIFGAAANGIHVSSRATAIVGMLATAIAWLSRSPFAHKLGLDKPDSSGNSQPEK